MSMDISSILLEAITNRSSINPAMLLAQMEDADPTIGLIAKYMAQRQAEERESKSSDEEEDELELAECSDKLDRTHEQSVERARALRELRRNVESMYAELEVLRDRNDSLAEALGACYLCWGQDVQCPVCLGNGQPGYFEPDRELFAQLIKPAASRFQKREGAVRRTSKKTNPRLPSNSGSTKGEDNER